jgi:iron-sulfur cluster assembly protein|tara:strand:+ start:86 stop:409 length:324 start_codon:yes stop_codon:yes gene_type:complete
MIIKLTETAAAEAKKYIEDNEEKYLRIGVSGGGCSGLQYSLQVGSDYNDEQDILSTQHEVDVVIDKKSALFLEGTTLDYYNDISKRGFVFENPNTVRSCGCGNSFQV